MADQKIQNSGPAVVADFSTSEGLTTDAAKVRQDSISSLSTTDIFQFIKSLALVAVSMNDTFTTLQAAPGYQKVTNGSVFMRPNFESHIFFDSQWIFTVTTGAVAPTTALTINLQTWLNGYHILISPSGFANDWTITIPPFAANTTYQDVKSFRGGIFNLELRKAPDFHLLQFMYQTTSIPAGWSQVQIKPRLTLVHSIPSSQISFQSI
jgi:hypothetical protein